MAPSELEIESPFEAFEEIVRIGAGPELVEEVVGSLRRDVEPDSRPSVRNFWSGFGILPFSYGSIKRTTVWIEGQLLFFYFRHDRSLPLSRDE